MMQSRSRFWSWLNGPAILALLLAGWLCVGCGGGGGATELLYQTDWTNRGRAVTGLSQRVRLYTASNQLVQTLVMNQDANGMQGLTIPVSGSGVYRLYVELYSQRDLLGVRTGVLETLVTLSGRTTFLSAVGEDPTMVKVTPESASVKVQHSRQYYAAGYSGANRAVFVEDEAFEWSALGGVASVNETGIALGLTPGSGTIRATHSDTGHQGSGLITVDPFQATQTKWTVMVFLNAANDLYTFSTLNVNQMESVAQNPDVRFIVQWKQSQSVWPSSSFDGTRRYLVKPDTTSSIASELIQDMGPGVDMGQASTLLDFVNWTKTYYPADRYVLVVWNHGNGWRRKPEDTLPTRAVSYDDETGNAIQTWQLSQAIGNNVLDIIAWDASLMQMLEVAYELQDRAQLIVGSEESPPGEGYPYDLIFGEFRDSPDASTVTLSKAFVDGMLAVPAYQTRKITQSVLDTSKLPALGASVSELASQLIANVGSIGTEIQTVRTQAKSYSPTAFRVYRDLYHVCELIESLIGIPGIQTAAADVRAKIADAVVWEGHNVNSLNSHGVSIDFSSSGTYAGVATDYAQLRFAQETMWNEWLSVAP